MLNFVGTNPALRPSKLIESNVFTYPQPEGLLILDLDASNVTISRCLSQVQDGVERVLAYGNKALSLTQRRYYTTKHILLTVVKFVKLYTIYLLHNISMGSQFLGVQIMLLGDGWLTLKFQNMLVQWISNLDTYDFTIQHRTGAKHSNADGLTLQKCTQ